MGGTQLSQMKMSLPNKAINMKRKHSRKPLEWERMLVSSVSEREFKSIIVSFKPQEHPQLVKMQRIGGCMVLNCEQAIYSTNSSLRLRDHCGNGGRG